MNNTAEQFITTNKANLQALEKLTTKAQTSVEKLVELNMATAKTALNESFSHIQAVVGAKNPQEFLALQAGIFKLLAEKSAIYSRHVYALVTDSSAEFTKTVEAKTAEAQKALSGVVENLAKNAPAGSETAVAAFKSALASGQNVIESAQSSAKKAVEAAESNFVAVTEQAIKAATSAAKID